MDFSMFFSGIQDDMRSEKKQKIICGQYSLFTRNSIHREQEKGGSHITDKGFLPLQEQKQYFSRFLRDN